MLEQYLLDEIDENLRERIDSDPEACKRLEELRESNKAILRQYPPGEIASLIEERRQENRSVSEGSFGRVRRIKWIAPLAAAALFAVVFGSVFHFYERSGVTGRMDDVVRIKGMTPHVIVYRKNGETAEKLDAGSIVGERDVLQLSYHAAGAQYGAIFSVDGRGVVTRHFPEEGERAVLLEQGGEVLLPFSYRLDNAPLFEVFCFITASGEFELEPIYLRLSRLTPGKEITLDDFTGLGSDLRYFILPLNKEARK